jgi:hypothetical protein
MDREQNGDCCKLAREERIPPHQQDISGPYGPEYDI